MCGNEASACKVAWAASSVYGVFLVRMMTVSFLAARLVLTPFSPNGVCTARLLFDTSEVGPPEFANFRSFLATEYLHFYFPVSFVCVFSSEVVLLSCRLQFMERECDVFRSFLRRAMLMNFGICFLPFSPLMFMI